MKLSYFLLALSAIVVLSGCNQNDDTNAKTDKEVSAYDTIAIQHELGTTVLEQMPERVAVFDMNDVDTLDQLDIPITGMAKDYIPHYLSQYEDNDAISDLGAIVQPNIESVYRLDPDLILITPIQARYYEELNEIAPTLHFDWDLTNKSGEYLTIVKKHILTLGHIFGKEALAREKLAQLDDKIAAARSIIENSDQRALIVMHNNGAYSSFGQASRFGFIFDGFGVKPASEADSTSLHGQPISGEFISATDPDIIFIVDRTAVMERQPTQRRDSMTTPLIKQTKAWQNDRVIFVDAQAWYVAAASISAIEIMLEDVLQAYQ